MVVSRVNHPGSIHTLVDAMPKATLILLLMLIFAFVNGFYHTVTSHNAYINMYLLMAKDASPTDSLLPAALCYPDQKIARIRGCDLITNEGIQKESKGKKSYADGVVVLPPLPCVSENSCPYDRFRCSKGHIWSAEPGSPVCFECPFCASKKGIRSSSYDRIPLRINRVLSDRVIKAINDNNGTCLNAEILIRKRVTYKSRLQLRCTKGHFWETDVDRIICQKAWCRECMFFNKVLGEEEFHKTASHFNGTFLGLVHPEDRFVIGSKARWSCEQGHMFSQSLQNIRRRPNGKRTCSWCPVCKKVGKVNFVWDPKKE